MADEELERIWMRMTVAYLQLLSYNLQGEVEGYHETSG
jgi:hypothetical protein